MLNKLFLIIFITNSLSGYEFLYPVAAQEDFIYFIYQKTIEHVLLCSWNIKDNIIKNNILNNCLPGNLTLLPSKKGFSFLDQGKIRIKYFNIDKIKTINLNEAVYNISALNWLDDENCYFSAKRGKRFNIFFVNILSNKLSYISQNSNDQKIGSDLLYPQKINQNLFFIERSVDERYRTKKSHYKIVKINYSNDTNSNVKLLTDADKIILIDFEAIPISFLKMTSETEGFFIEHASLIEKTDQIISFTMHRIYFDKIKNIFQTTELFDFNLLTKYLFGKNNERLYESVLPFLPKIYEDKIIYSHCSNENKLAIDLFSYDLKSKNIKQETISANTEICFSPLVVNQKLFYGYNILNEIPDKIKENYLPLLKTT